MTERQNESAQIIAIAGGSGSGKSTVARRLQALLGSDMCQILCQDNYYKDQSQDFAGDGTINYDHPEAIDFELLAMHLAKLKENKPVCVPVYNFSTHTREPHTIFFSPTPVVLLDGILLLTQKALFPFFLASVFVDAPEEVRLARRLKRDIEERGRNPEGVKTQFLASVKPMHDAFVQPSARFATYVITDETSLQQCFAGIFALLNHRSRAG